MTDDTNDDTNNSSTDSQACLFENATPAEDPNDCHAAADPDPINGHLHGITSSGAMAILSCSERRPVDFPFLHV